MSGLEKFGGTQAWFAQFRTLLFQNRPLPPKDQILKSEEEDSTHSDLSEELVSLINEKIMYKNKESENDNSIHLKNHTSSRNRLNDTTFIEEPSLWRQTTDESFENTERLCDQTSNLNQTTCLSDQTNLENIEPPSFLFENTLMGNGTLQLSPTKMVGLNRPPTIFEESINTTNNSDGSSFSFKTIETNIQKSESGNSTVSSSFSFKTAGGGHAHKDDLPNTTYSTASSTSHYKPAETNSQKSESGSEQYETAYESLKDTDEKLYKYTQDVTIVCESVLDLSEKEVATNNEDSINKTQDTSSSLAAAGVTFPLYKKRPFFTDDISSKNLSDKTRTLSSSRSRNCDTRNASSNITTESRNTMSDVSSLLEDSVDISNRRCINLASEMTLDSLYTRTRDESDLLDLDEMLEQRIKAEETSDVISLSSDDEADREQSNNNREENSMAITSGKEFNDTIEEMEYIMQQGMKYLTEKGAVPKVGSCLTASKIPSHIPTLKQNQQVSSNTYSPRSMKKVEKIRDMDPVFKMPSTAKNRKADAESKKKNKFDHIISPVGAYINYTATVPLVTTIRPTNDLYKSKLVRELEYEKHNPKPLTERNAPPKTTAGLPRKVYVAAEFQSYVDERTPVTIPGGNKIHRYLSAAPTVMKHVGRIKGNDGDKEHIPQNVTIDETLADVSRVSGNVSLLTIKDARKMQNSGR